MSFYSQAMRAKEVRKIRYTLDWTQNQVAKSVGVDVRTIQNWESKGCPKWAGISLKRVLDEQIHKQETALFEKIGLNK